MTIGGLAVLPQVKITSLLRHLQIQFDATSMLSNVDLKYDLCIFSLSVVN
jgi:hypothetical protein